MKLDTHEDETFETSITEDNYFAISITKESDFSSDGGYSFEQLCSSIHLNRAGAFDLMLELRTFLKCRGEE